MGFFSRIFGNKPASASVAAKPEAADIPPERVGPDGKQDQSGLAKRVALAFDEDAGLTDVDTLWVAQTGTTVVLKGTVPSQDVLNKMVSVAKGVKGAKEVNTEQVKVA
jgi:osmotically-inducible protein OsmY